MRLSTFLVIGLIFNINCDNQTRPNYIALPDWEKLVTTQPNFIKKAQSLNKKELNCLQFLELYWQDNLETNASNKNIKTGSILYNPTNFDIIIEILTASSSDDFLKSIIESEKQTRLKRIECYSQMENKVDRKYIYLLGEHQNGIKDLMRYASNEFKAYMWTQMGNNKIELQNICIRAGGNELWNQVINLGLGFENNIYEIKHYMLDQMQIRILFAQIWLKQYSQTDATTAFIILGLLNPLTGSNTGNTNDNIKFYGVLKNQEFSENNEMIKTYNKVKQFRNLAKSEPEKHQVVVDELNKRYKTQ